MDRAHLFEITRNGSSGQLSPDRRGHSIEELRGAAPRHHAATRRCNPRRGGSLHGANGDRDRWSSSYLVPIAIVFYSAMIAMIVSASAFAYRSLVPAPEGTAAEFA